VDDAICEVLETFEVVADDGNDDLRLDVAAVSPAMLRKPTMLR